MKCKKLINIYNYMPLDVDNIAKVVYGYRGSDKEHEELLSSEHVDEYIKAMLKLHLNPGKNPYTGSTCSKLSYLAVKKPTLYDGYWWTSSSLTGTGVPIATFMHDRYIYMSSEVHAKDFEALYNEAMGEAQAALGCLHITYNTKEICSYLDDKYKEFQVVDEPTVQVQEPSWEPVEEYEDLDLDLDLDLDKCILQE